MLHGGVPQPGPGHRGLGQTLEEAGGVRVPREGEVSTGVEEQDGAAEALHAAGPAPGQDDLRRQVRQRGSLLGAVHFTATLHSQCV